MHVFVCVRSLLLYLFRYFAIALVRPLFLYVLLYVVRSCCLSLFCLSLFSSFVCFFIWVGLSFLVCLYLIRSFFLYLVR